MGFLISQVATAIAFTWIFGWFYGTLVWAGFWMLWAVYSNLPPRYTVYARAGFNKKGTAVFIPTSNHTFHAAARFEAYHMEKALRRPFIVGRPMSILIAESK